MIHTLLPVLFGIAVDVNGACLDADPGCTEYLRLGDSCYSEWAEKHCKRTCGKCDPDPDPAPSASAPLTAVTSSGKKAGEDSEGPDSARDSQEGSVDTDQKTKELAAHLGNHAAAMQKLQDENAPLRVRDADGEGEGGKPSVLRKLMDSGEKPSAAQ